RRHTRFSRDWSSDVCSSDLLTIDSKNNIYITDLETKSVLKVTDKREVESFLLQSDLYLGEKTNQNSFPYGIAVDNKDNVYLTVRSEERRVGKECGSWCWRYQ